MVIKIQFNLNGDLFDYNTFEEIIQLENYNDIKYINCSYNNLTSLSDNLPNSLEFLSCSHNNLTSLPDNLPNSLEFLWCGNNNLTSLSDNLPYSLEKIWCYDNNLTSLPDNLPNSLIGLSCDNNNLTSLPDNLPNSLTNLWYDNNPIYNFIEEYHNGNWKEYIKWKNKYKSPSNIIGSWFLDCKYNPKYKYCKDRLNEEYDLLYS